MGTWCGVASPGSCSSKPAYRRRSAEDQGEDRAERLQEVLLEEDTPVDLLAAGNPALAGEGIGHRVAVPGMDRENFESRVAVEGIAVGVAGHIVVAGEVLHIVAAEVALHIAAVVVLHMVVGVDVHRVIVAAADLHIAAAAEVLHTVAVEGHRTAETVEVEEGVEVVLNSPAVPVEAGHKETAGKEIGEDPDLGVRRAWSLWNG